MVTKILVVEDEADLEFLLTRKFRQRISEGQYDFAFAHNGVEALNILRTNPDIHIVLSDIRMPEMDGLSLLTVLNEQYPLIRTIIVSAYGDMRNVRTAMNRGAFDFLIKPIDFQDLETTLQKTIRHVQQNLAETAEHKKLEEQLLQLQKAVENMQLGVTVTNLQGKILYTNPAEAKMHGYDVSDLIGQDVGVLAPPTLRQPVSLEEIKRWKGSVRESVNIRKDGSLFPVWLMSEIVRDPNGEPTAFVTSCEDITERKRAEEALRQSEIKYRELVQNANSCIIRMTPQGRITFFNEFAQWFFGYAEQEILGQNMLGTIVPDTDSAASELAEVIDGLLKYPRRYMNRESENVRASGERVWMAWTNKAIIDSTGRLNEVLCVGNDISERKAMEEELRKHRDHLEELVKERTLELTVANTQLQQEISDRKRAEEALQHAKETAEEARRAAEDANHAKNDFLANMSHELRTPLNGILGYTQILKRDPQLTAAQQDAISVIHRSGEHLLTMINDVLDLAKIEARKMDLDIHDFRLPEILRTIVEIARVRAEQKGITFEYLADADLPQGVRGDEKRLRQVLLNLLSNAVKFTLRGSVTLRVRKQESGGSRQFVDCKLRTEDWEPPPASCLLPPATIRFEVEDTGIGIPPEHLDKIFMEFHQVKDERVFSEGTGLGLSISRQLVAMMGGTLQVKSVLHQGSLFWFDLVLPVTDDTHMAETHSERQQRIVGIQGPPRTVLLADDNDTNRAVLKDLLTPLGFQVHEVVNGRAMLEATRTTRFDLILLDIVMPVMDGLEAVRQLRRQPEGQHVPVIAISASVSLQRKQESLAAGCQAFLAKPFHLDELFACIQELLHLEWIYSATSETPCASSERLATPAAEPAHMVPPPPEVLAELHQVVLVGQITRLRKLLDQIEAQDPSFQPFVAHLRRLAKDFQIDEIQHLIEQYGQSEGKHPQ